MINWLPAVEWHWTLTAGNVVEILGAVGALGLSVLRICRRFDAQTNKLDRLAERQEEIHTEFREQHETLRQDVRDIRRALLPPGQGR